MHGNFEIAVDPSHHRLVLRLVGFLSEEQFKLLARAQQEAERAAAGKGGAYDVLLDLTESKPQAQDVVQALKTFADSSRLKARRVAAVVESALVERQLLRALEHSNIKVFRNHQRAEDWLNSST